MRGRSGRAGRWETRSSASDNDDIGEEELAAGQKEEDLRRSMLKDGERELSGEGREMVEIVAERSRCG